MMLKKIFGVRPIALCLLVGFAHGGLCMAPDSKPEKIELEQKDECIICSDELDEELSLVHDSGSNKCKGFAYLHPSCLLAYIVTQVKTFNCFKEFHEKTVDPKCPICHKKTLLSENDKDLLITQLAKQYHKISADKLSEWWKEQVGLDKQIWEKEFKSLPKPAKKNNKRLFSELEPDMKNKKTTPFKPVTLESGWKMGWLIEN